jgi:hypothetical protein
MAADFRFDCDLDAHAPLKNILSKHGQQSEKTNQFHVDVLSARKTGNLNGEKPNLGSVDVLLGQNCGKTGNLNGEKPNVHDWINDCAYDCR